LCNSKNYDDGLLINFTHHFQAKSEYWMAICV